MYQGNRELLEVGSVGNSCAFQTIQASLTLSVTFSSGKRCIIYSAHNRRSDRRWETVCLHQWKWFNHSLPSQRSRDEQTTTNHDWSLLKTQQMEKDRVRVSVWESKREREQRRVRERAPKKKTKNGEMRFLCLALLAWSEWLVIESPCAETPLVVTPALWRWNESEW